MSEDFRLYDFYYPSTFQRVIPFLVTNLLEINSRGFSFYMYDNRYFYSRDDGTYRDYSTRRVVTIEQLRNMYPDCFN